MLIGISSSCILCSFANFGGKSRRTVRKQSEEGGKREESSPRAQESKNGEERAHEKNCLFLVTTLFVGALCDPTYYPQPCDVASRNRKDEARGRMK